MIVVDASVMVDFLADPTSTARIREVLGQHGDEVHAPAHLDLEVASALRRHVRRGSLSEPMATAVMRDLADFPLQRSDLAVLMPRVWALRDTVSPYDAAYVALAEALEAPLLTRDARLARSHGHGATVQLLT